MHRQPISSPDTFSSTDIFSTAAFPSRPTTREGLDPRKPQPPPLTQSHSTTSIQTLTSNAVLEYRDRIPSFARKAASFSGARRRGSSITSNSANAIITDATIPPALPNYALSAAPKVPLKDQDRELESARNNPTSPDSSRRMLNRTNTSSTLHTNLPPPTPIGGVNGGNFWQPSDLSNVHQDITDLAHKRIATLRYLRKAHAGRVYWFNTYLFEKSDLGRMACFDPRRLGRKATNYLLLGISLPVVVDLYSSTPLEFLKTFGTLLSEFDSFQQLRSDSSASLARARLPNMFRRPGVKSRRSTSAADSAVYEEATTPHPSNGAGPGGFGPTSNTSSVMTFAASESDLLPGEEYAYLLTPSLPFEPDYFETFATLCDALIDCYTRFLTLVPTSRECTSSVAELFTKADARVRKIIVQGIVKDFEDSSRNNVRSEVASLGKVVLGGLM